MNDDALYLHHIVECIERIQNFTAEGEAPFAADVKTRNPSHISVQGVLFVGVAGFEPTTSSSRTTRATELRHTPRAQNLRCRQIGGKRKGDEGYAATATRLGGHHDRKTGRSSRNI